MQKFEIQLNLEHIKQARKAYNDAAREFGERVDKAMKRLIHEAAAQRMSITEVGKLSGFTSAQIKARMKAMNLNPTTGKTLLSKQAADVLASNAEIMGIEPYEIDLMSPLAYLPAGSLLKDKAQSQGVTDLDEAVSGNEIDPDSEEVWVFAKTIMETLVDETYDATGGYILRDDPRNLAIRLMRAGYRLPQTDKTQAFPETDTLAPWLYQRFARVSGRGTWADLSFDDQAYWDHQAAAVRRAVARGGFKNSAQADEAGA